MSRERPSWRESADRYWCRLQRGHWRGTAADWTTTRVEWASKCDQLIAEMRQWAGADKLDGWSPDLADRADDWATKQEDVEVRAALEAELAEYQQQMEAAYARQQYEDRENEARRRSSWMPVDEGPWW